MVSRITSCFCTLAVAICIVIASVHVEAQTSTLLETLFVPADGSVVTSEAVLETGVPYLVRVSGTVTIDCCNDQGDAEWQQFPNGVTSTCGTDPDVDMGV